MINLTLIRLKVLFRYLPLLKELVVRDIKVRYRKSVLGILWTVLNPVLTMLIITMVFSSMFKSNISNFPLYVLIGNVVFAFNADATTQSLMSILANASLIKKVYIPKYLFPLSKAFSGLVNLGFSIISLIIVMIITGATFHMTTLGLIIPILYLFIFSLGLGTLLSAINVFFRDIGHLYSVFITLWMYITPIFYTINILPENIQFLVKFNPLYHYITFIRQLVMEGIFPGLLQNFTCGIISLGMLLFGLITFKKLQDRFILYI